MSARLACLALVGCAASDPGATIATEVTTSGAIALANLDHLIAQRGDDPAQVDLLLTRARLLSDAAALDRATVLAEAAPPAPLALIRRAQTRAAAHRFADALADLAAAERAGVQPASLAPARAAILIATGHAAAAVPLLATAPDYAHRAALAGAYAALGAFAAADALYVAADAALDTTSPFPHAWLDFARGLMWSEQAGDPARGEPLYRRAVARLPQLAVGQLHLAELEAGRGETAAAIARIAPLADADPEALGLLGALHVRARDLRGWLELTRARARYEALLARHLLAYADHAAELHLRPAGDRERAWQLASQNLANRATRRAWRLAVTAAAATSRWPAVVALAADLPANL